MADPPDATDARLTRVLRAYLEAQYAGTAPDRADLLTLHPDLHDELTAYFETAGVVDACRRGLSPPPPTSVPGAIAGYRLQEELGRGGMGVVYKAVQSLLGRTVALKVLHADEPSVAERLLAEARAAARLDHPGIVPIFEVGSHNGRPFLAMAFVPGETLAARVQRGPMPPSEAARVVRDVALAVQHAHEHGVIHRDLKPANILLTADGRSKVTDFGLAKRSGEATLSTDGQVLGTPAYMPPEFAAGAAVRAGPAADVYGLGAVFYALLTGRAPFDGETPLETIRRVAYDDPPPPRQADPRIDRAAEAICLRCLEKNPQHRYATAEALAADLGLYLAGEVPLAERLEWNEWLRRKLNRAIDFDHAKEWSRLFATAAVAFPVAHVGYFLATREATNAGTFWIAFLVAMCLTTWLPCAAAARIPRLDSREREILLFWLAISVGQLLLFANHCPLWGEVRAAEVGRFFASSSVLYGVTFFAQGRLYWGQLYVLALTCFAGAAVLMNAGAVAPVVYGGFQAVAFAVVSRHLSRVARRRSRAPAAP